MPGAEPDPQPKPEAADEAAEQPAGGEPVVLVRDGAVFANSRDVAAFFGKRHADVLRAIERLECTGAFRERNFALTHHYEQAGAVDRQLPCFEMTKDGFTFLVMGYTGAEAVD